MVPPPSAPPTPTSPFPSPNTQQPSSLSRLTLSDKLLLSQAVHHIGTSPPDWGRVSSILLSHPLIRTKNRLDQASKAGITLGRVFGSRECERAWVALMRQYNLVLQPGEKEVVNESEGESSSSSSLANRAKEARGLPPKTDRGSQLALAQFLYAERIREIQENIKVKEQRFKSLVADIEALNSGALDAKLNAEVKTLNSQPITPAIETSSRLPPKDRSAGTGPTATTPGGSVPRTTRISRSGSSTALPGDGLDSVEEAGVLATERQNGKPNTNQEEAQDGDDVVMKENVEGGEEEVEETPKAAPVKVADIQLREDDVPIVEEEEVILDKLKDKQEESAADGEAQAAGSDGAEHKDGAALIAEKDGEELPAEAEEGTEPAQKSTRSSKRKRISDAGLSATEQKKTRNREEVEEIAEVGQIKHGNNIGEDEKEEEGETEADEDNEEDAEPGEETNNRRRSQPRRSRRAGRGAGAEDESMPPTPITPASAVTSAAKGRLGALQSRETSGASGGEEEGEGTELDISRSMIDRGSRTSLSPVSVRRGRGNSRFTNNVGASRRSRGGSNTSRNEAELSEAEREKAKRKNEKVLNMILQEVSNHTHGNLFHSAIKEQDAPDYYALVRRPLDIKTIKTKIKEGGIVNSTQLRRALNQMFANSLIYNRPGTEIHRMALEMRDSAEEIIDRFEQTQLSASYARR